jgi:2-polyprenyl-6-methoxyphenol hydroxylase-like FAD-dependent oxidoreductase
MTNRMNTETDVLIIGGGPTGMTLACELLRRGIRIRILEKTDALAQTSRALGVQARTLEIFENMGIVDKVLSEGVPLVSGTVYERDKPLLNFRWDHLKGEPYPFVLATPQNGTERALNDLVIKRGGSVERSRELVSFQQDADGVTAVVQDKAGTQETIHAQWMVGADGGRSIVRKSLGVRFEGLTYDEEFLLADVDLDWDRSHDSSHLWVHADGLFVAMPLPHTNHWRLFVDVVPDSFGEVPHASLAVFHHEMAKRTGDAKTGISNVTWASNFKINRRMVDAYRVGRVFLAGDAAHIHSPFGGQGMNTGIQDAYNLAWKLALVVKGKAHEALLNTYQEERLPVAQATLTDTHRNTQLILNKNPLFRLVRETLLPRLLSLDIVQAAIVREASELYINYRASSLSHNHDGSLSGATLFANRRSEKPSVKDWLDFQAAPRAGDRAPQVKGLYNASGTQTTLFKVLNGTQFTLLLFDGLAQTSEGYQQMIQAAQSVEALLGEEVKTSMVIADGEKPANLNWQGPIVLDPECAAHKTYGTAAQSLYLIRPDGYVGFRSQPIREDALREYLNGICSARPGRSETADPGR